MTARAIGGSAFAGLSLLLAACAIVHAAAPPPPEPTLSEWIASETDVAIERLFRNISPVDARPGTVVASPSRDAPNYYFHWTRDSSLVMTQVIALYEQATGARRAALARAISDYVSLSRLEQTEPSAEGLGEPRFLVSGPADTTPWARPQYDGPALRALALMRFIRASAASPGDEPARAAAVAVVRADLEFAAKTAGQPCFDLWEEQRGLHFYTEAVQYAALSRGALFFSTGSDAAFAATLAAGAAGLETELEKFWDARRGYIGASRDVETKPGAPAGYRADNLDTAVLLASLHAGMGSGILLASGDRMLATAAALESTFRRIYRIDGATGGDSRVSAMGRFADDTYFGGNPWYMTTAAFAEFHYRVAREIERAGGIDVSARSVWFFASLPRLRFTVAPGRRIRGAESRELVSALRTEGDAFLATVRKYAGSQGELAEQFDRVAGVPASARDLSWSYAAFLSAAGARNQ